MGTDSSPAVGPARPWALVAILAIAVLVRVWGVWFGLPSVQARPDEEAVVGVAVGFVEGKWWPGFFDYPRLLMYVLAAIYALYYVAGAVVGTFASFPDFLAHWHREWWLFFLIGRVVSVASGAAAVWMLHRLADRLAGRRVALVSAFLLAAAFLHVRESHYATTDAFMTLLALWCVTGAARFAETGAPRAAYAAALLAGLAAATKYNAVLLALPLGVAGALRMRACAGCGLYRRLAESRWVPMALIMVAVFVALSPYLLFDLERFRIAMDHLWLSYSEVGMITGADTAPGWLHHLRVSLWWGVGWPILVAAAIGVAVLARRVPGPLLIVLAFVIPYFAVAAASRLLFVRYMVSIVPFVCLFAAAGVDAVGARLAFPRLLPAKAAVALLAALAAAPTLTAVVRFDRLLARTDSRAIAADWIRANIPRGSRIAQSGSRYGRVDFGMDGGYEIWEYDRHARRFMGPHRSAVSGVPDVIVVHESPLPYSYVLPGMASTLRYGYAPVYRVRALDMNKAAANVYDMQDAFFLPYAGFDGINRPGPNVSVWQRSAAANQVSR